MVEHKDLPLGERDGAINLEYADEAERLAAEGLSENSIGNFAWQTSDDTVWLLKSVDPLVWAPVGGSPGTLVHSELEGLDSDDHDQYLPRDGARSMDGPLRAVTVTYTGIQQSTPVDGVVVCDFSSRQQVIVDLSSISDVDIQFGTPVGPGRFDLVLMQGASVSSVSFSAESGMIYGTLEAPEDPDGRSLITLVYVGGHWHAFTQQMPQYGSKITIEHTGSTFSPILSVEPEAVIEWAFSDGTTSDSATPNKDFGTAETRQTTLLVSPATALNGISLGYVFGEDGATLGVEYAVEQQNVTDILGISAYPSLEFITLSRNPIESLDISGCSSLDTIECYLGTNLISITATGCTAIRRVCFERCDLTVLDISASQLLEDVRFANQGQQAVGRGLQQLILPDVGYRSAIWHLCGWGNAFNTALPTEGLTALSDLFMENAGLSGTLTLDGGSLSTARLWDNQISVLDIRGACRTGAASLVNAENNLLASVLLSGNPYLLNIYLGNNPLLGETGVDQILSDCIANGRPGGYLDITGCGVPSTEGEADAVLLEGDGWTVDRDVSAAPLIATLSPQDNAADVGVGATFTISFNEAVEAFAGGEITLVETGVGNFRLFDVVADTTGSGTASISFTADTDMENLTGYHVLISGDALRSVASSLFFAGISTETRWNIVTEAADVPIPVIVTLDPDDESLGVAVDATFTVTFNVAVYSGSGDVVFYDSDDLEVGRVPASSVDNLGTSSVSFSPPSNLEHNTGHYIQIENTAFQNSESEFFAGILDNTTWNFTTVEATGVVIWFEEFTGDEATPDPDWQSGQGTTAELTRVSNQGVLSGDFGYQQCYRAAIPVTVPADVKVSFELPYTEVENGFYGLALRYDPTSLERGTRVFVQSGVLPNPTITVGDASFYNDNNVTVTVTGNVPSTWGDPGYNGGMCRFGAQIIGTAGKIFLNDQEYGTFIHNVNNASGHTVAFVGQVGPGRVRDNLLIETPVP